MANDGASGGASINYTVFILMVVIGSLFMLNLVIGVLSGEFSKERELVEKRGSYLKMKEEKKLKQAMDGYLNWIAEGERIMQEEEMLQHKAPTVIQKPPTVNLSHFLGEEFNDDKVSVHTEQMEVQSTWKSDMIRTIQIARARIRTMVKSPFWFWLILFLVFVNTALRCSVHHNMPEWWSQILLKFEITFLVIFSGLVRKIQLSLIFVPIYFLTRIFSGNFN